MRLYRFWTVLGGGMAFVRSALRPNLGHSGSLVQVPKQSRRELSHFMRLGRSHFARTLLRRHHVTSTTTRAL